ncbi:translation initiation factor SUI1, putative [Plasmodium vivax]|uniref:SUI1 domain-containing protein n=6 Tax=Plasmodium vivax TaxID=5855 RepID=A5JZP3_PLAVS|nr:hypothetical protein, conserved [Plasmodium vivax]KMZ78003.1 hypothetical protein PVIIG_00690 [Plasmodium vivax India VII]KMZ84343.1 hypothetical protein PVBG_00123 [Plasmodium vivax Brazil I]KMZ90123.1 hypothetical protein PVMG_01490 [Plasmodium vivax Mauritania I]KMZ97230.1 hypothetical protein PVNG_00257 [Plasmodium vivax North Korean]EDL47454.1 hypothetical protein, conserved [Plasmodium vivax]|eukprot:XP_001617181.1 hypothetical protein [Plasmodium vivax Sal-1]
MDELQSEFEKMKIKSDAEEEEQEGEESGEEKISQRKLRYLKMKDKKEEKKRKKQGTKGTTNKNAVESNSKVKNNDSKDEQKNGDNSRDDENANDVSNNLNENNEEDQDASAESPQGNKAAKCEPVLVDYCKVCGMPYEYCEYGNSFNQCKEANKEKYNYDIVRGDAETSNKRQAKKAPQNATQKITIQKTTRARKKVVTVVVGLHTYVKLDKMAKIFSRFYACGASVIKGANGAPDQIDIQGDVEHNIVEIIMKNCPEIPEGVFVTLPPK